MLTIVICVGSSCHVRGSDDVAEIFERLTRERKLENQVQLIGAFCTDHCSMGVSVRLGDKVFRGVRPDSAEEFFLSEIVPALEGNSLA
jgi:NADH:ubiquinone oxidoreductase subunit E